MARILGSGCFQVNLDDRKLKTPAGKLLTVPNEALAAAIATEWSIQKVRILN